MSYAPATIAGHSVSVTNIVSSLTVSSSFLSAQKTPAIRGGLGVDSPGPVAQIPSSVVAARLRGASRLVFEGFQRFTEAWLHRFRGKSVWATGPPRVTDWISKRVVWRADPKSDRRRSNECWESLPRTASRPVEETFVLIGTFNG
jgi:hypothetical protein